MKKTILSFLCILVVIFSGCSSITNKNKDDTQIISTIDSSNMDTSEKHWFFKPNKNGTPPETSGEGIALIKKYSGYYLGDTSKKVVYLTFDEGYENGYTPVILDILKKNNVKAAFFATTPYINTNKDLVKRMSDEGHLVCNHSTTHPSMAKITDKQKFEKELKTCEGAFEEATGKKMPKFFRPPMGKYSELSLYYTQSLGYKTIFWSSAYADWDTKKQAGTEHAKKLMLERTHNGNIILLHAVSKTNASILSDLIKEWKAMGFSFESLDSLK